jgi:hypothetical protein
MPRGQRDHPVTPQMALVYAKRLGERYADRVAAKAVSGRSAVGECGTLFVL